MKSVKRVETSLGELTLVAQKGDGPGTAVLVGVYFPHHQPAPRLDGVTDEPPDEAVRTLLERAAREMEAYLAGRATTFSVPFAFEGTALQQDVWRALLAIPRGQTRTYGELAASIGRAGSPRAIGQMVARNPLSIVVPCHRVLASGARLNGFAGGVDRKAQLLTLESASFHVPRVRAPREGASAEPRGAEASAVDAAPPV